MSKFKNSKIAPPIDAATIASMSMRQLQESYAQCSRAAASASRACAQLGRAMKKAKRAEEKRV